MHPLPQDLANLLAVAIRDVIWFKDKVLSFLKSCGVPEGIMIEVRRMNREKVPTIKLVQHVHDRLAASGDEGDRIARKLLTEMHYWKDLHAVLPDKKEQAVASLKAFQCTRERVILMDGMDLRCVLDCQMAFDVLPSEKQAAIVKGQKTSPLVSARDIIAKRSRPAG